LETREEMRGDIAQRYASKLVLRTNAQCYA
jgi:hypothetical protein